MTPPPASSLAASSSPAASSTALAGLVHFRWALPVLAELAAVGGQSKFAALQHRLGVSRSSLQRTLAALVEAGWVRRNPGYGHPLRPEYLLTVAGEGVAAASTFLTRDLDRLEVRSLALNKWSLPVLITIERAEGRFNGLLSHLADVTPRALARALQDLQGSGLLERVLIDDRPPRTEYRLTPTGCEVEVAAADLTRAIVGGGG